MALVNLARDIICDALIGGSDYTKFGNANAYIGVGNGTTAFAATQTDLQGASQKRNAMDATYPQRAANALTFRATFGTADANFAWEEWGLFNNGTLAAGQMLNRSVGALGTKVNTATWQMTVTLTITLA